MLSKNPPIRPSSGSSHSFNANRKRSLDLVREEDSQTTLNHYKIPCAMDTERPNKKQMTEEWNCNNALSNRSDWVRQRFVLPERNMKNRSFPGARQAYEIVRVDVPMEDEGSKEEVDKLRNPLEDRSPLPKLSMWPRFGEEAYTRLHLLADAAGIRPYEVLGSSKISPPVLDTKSPISQNVKNTNQGMRTPKARSRPSGSLESQTSEGFSIHGEQSKKGNFPTPPNSRDGSTQGVERGIPQTIAQHGSVLEPSTQEGNCTAANLDVPKESLEVALYKTRLVKHDRDVIETAKAIWVIFERERVVQKVKDQNARLDGRGPVAPSYSKLSHSRDGRSAKHTDSSDDSIEISTFTTSASAQEIDLALDTANNDETGYETEIDKKYATPDPE